MTLVIAVFVEYLRWWSRRSLCVRVNWQGMILDVRNSWLK